MKFWKSGLVACAMAILAVACDGPNAGGDPASEASPFRASQQPLSGNTVLILSTTVSSGMSSPEAVSATLAGFSVEVATPAQWAAKTVAQFASYRAIVMGDPTCGYPSTPLTAAVANNSVWGSVIDGNVILIGTDPVFHFLVGGLAHGGIHSLRQQLPLPPLTAPGQDGLAGPQRGP